MVGWLTCLCSDDPWVGLVYCNGTSEQWVACGQQAKETTVTKADACFCPSTSRTVAFTDKSVLDNVVLLPTALGQSVIWQPGYVPTPTFPTTGGSSSTSAATSTPTSSGSTTSAPTAAPTAATTEDMPTGTKIGIGVGVGVGGALLLCLLAQLFLRHRRTQKAKAAARADGSEFNSPESKHTGLGIAGAGSSPMPGTPGTPGTFATSATTAPSELEPTAARPWSLRSELHGSGTPASLAEQQHMGAIRDARIPDGGLHPNSLENSPRPGHTPPGGRGPLSPVAELPG